MCFWSIFTLGTVISVHISVLFSLITHFTALSPLCIWLIAFKGKCFASKSSGPQKANWKLLPAHSRALKKIMFCTYNAHCPTCHLGLRPHTYTRNFSVLYRGTNLFFRGMSRARMPGVGGATCKIYCSPKLIKNVQNVEIFTCGEHLIPIAIQNSSNFVLHATFSIAPLWNFPNARLLEKWCKFNKNVKYSEIFAYGRQNTFLNITNDLDQCGMVRKVFYINLIDNAKMNSQNFCRWWAVQWQTVLQ